MQQSEQYFQQQIQFARCRYKCLKKHCKASFFPLPILKRIICIWMLQVLNQDETPLLYSLVFGEGVVNDATSVVLFKAIQNFDLSHIDLSTALQLIGNFLYLFIASTVLGIFVSFPVTFYYVPSPFSGVIVCLGSLMFFFLFFRLDCLVLTS